MKINKIALFILLFNCICIDDMLCQNANDIKSIQTSIYLNFIHYSCQQISQKQALIIFENIKGDLNTDNAPPFVQQMSLYPHCVSTINIKEISKTKYLREGVLYEYDISNLFDCLNKKTSQLNVIYEVENISHGNQYFKSEGLEYPNLIYRKGLVFFSPVESKICFISGFLNKSSIREIFETKNLTNGQLAKIVGLRYFNYAPKNLVVISNKKNKKIRFESEYESLRNVYFIVDYKNDFDIEHISINKRN